MGALRLGALMDACRADNVEVLRILAQHGGVVDSVSLFEAVAHGSLNVVEEVVVAHGVDLASHGLGAVDVGDHIFEPGR